MTVGSVRAAAESTGEIIQFKKTIGRDGKERPARKVRAADAPPLSSPSPPSGYIGASTIRLSWRRKAKSLRELEELRRDLLGKPVFDISVLTLAWQAVEHAAHASNKLKFKKSLRKLQKAILSVISD